MSDPIIDADYRGDCHHTYPRALNVRTGEWVRTDDECPTCGHVPGDPWPPPGVCETCLVELNVRRPVVRDGMCAVCLDNDSPNEGA